MHAHTVEFCPVCGSVQNYEANSTFDGITYEASTHCIECGHKDYFAYGQYEEIGRLTDFYNKLVTQQYELES